MSTLAVQMGFEDEHACASCCPDLSYTTRLYGFIGCTGIGFLLSSIGSFILFSGFTEKNITTFIILYIIGNFMSIGGTLFLSGPKSQCVKMWDKSRRFSTCFYLIMLVVVFVVAVTKQHIAVILSMLVIEILAATWYSLSFIPYGRNMVIGCCRGGPCGVCFKWGDAANEKCDACCKSCKKNLGVKEPQKNWYGGEKTTTSNDGGWFGGAEEKPASGSWFGGSQK